MVWGVVMSPSFIVFLSVSFIGTVLVLLSNGLLGIWLCMELAFFGFIPILNGKGVCENEAASKYFIMQSVGSGILLVSFLLISSSNFMYEGVMELIIDVFLMLGFLIKLGVFPMHFWFPTVMSSSSWFSCFWLSVMQKIGPFWGVSGLGMSYMLVSVFLLLAVITSLVGAVGGLAQVHFRPLLAYSSLGQMGWMSCILFLNLEMFIAYMFLYSLLLIALLMGLNMMSNQSINESPGWGDLKGLTFWVFSGSYFISLAGVPPMAGFVLKFAGVFILVKVYPLFLIILLISSMISLYFYLNMLISSLVCLGSMGYTSLSYNIFSRSVAFYVLAFNSVNWLGGLPLFLVAGFIIS
uniref:NADH dehydrogenase subunit 2 n=1 Tax=Latona dysoni TaxID=3246695 RepID=UPI0021150ACF|nr:NADH dehydrogenase subunit 2 [Donax dysoni]UTM92209.1 NADH dehydrogenase subunit 2 [Donax dysoni]